MRREHQRSCFAVFQALSKPLAVPSLPLALEMSLAKPAGSGDLCIKHLGVFYGAMVRQRLDRQGLSVAMPSWVGIVPWAIMKQSDLHVPLHAQLSSKTNRLGPLIDEVLPPPRQLWPFTLPHVAGLMRVSHLPKAAVRHQPVITKQWRRDKVSFVCG